MIQGQYFFEDKLKFEKEDWEHCTGGDRRFHQQALGGIKPAGSTQLTRQNFPYSIPHGTYDVGEGYYEPIKSIIYQYSGEILRTPHEDQVSRIVSECRYNPKILNITGAEDKMIRKVIEKNKEGEAMKNL